MAPPQTPSIHDINNPISPYHSHFPVSRTPSRTPYRWSNFYDPVKSQSDLTPPNKLLTANYGLTSRQPSFGSLRRHPSVLVNNEDDSRSFAPRKEFTMSQSDLIPSNQLYADYGLVNREPSFGNRRSDSSILVNSEEDLRNFGARKQFTIGSRSDDYFDDSFGYDLPNELSPFGTLSRSLNPLTGDEGNSRSFRSNFNNELSFNSLRGSSPSVDREGLKNFGLNPRSDRYLSDSFERSNPMSESDQYPRTEFNQFPKAPSSQLFRVEPRQYTKVQPSQFSKIEPGQFFRTEPKQFPHVQPSQSFKFELSQFSKVVEPSQFSKVQSNQFSEAEPSQYLRIQPNEYSVAENRRVSYEREPKVTRPQFVQSQRSQKSEDSNRPVYVPEVKHNSYNLPEELNVFRMTQKVGKDEVEVVNNSRREKQSDERKKDQEPYEIDENSEQMGTEMDDYNEQLKSRDVTQEIKRKGDVVSKDSNSGDKSGFSEDRSLGEDSSNSRLMERSKKIEDEGSTTKTVSGV